MGQRAAQVFRRSIVWVTLGALAYATAPVSANSQDGITSVSVLDAEFSSTLNHNIATSEIFEETDRNLTQYYQRGVVDWKSGPRDGAYSLHRRCRGTFSVVASAVSEDQGVEPDLLNPNAGDELGPWGHKVSNFAVDDRIRQYFQAVVDAERALIHMHGAALTRAGRTVLIPGASGVGKSTLTLAANGFELLGDDVIFIDPESGSVHPFQRAPHVHDDAIPRLVSAGFNYRHDSCVGPYLECQAVTTWRHQPALPLTHVLFVEWDQDGPVETVTKTQAETAIELAPVSHNLRSRPDTGLPQLKRVLAGATSYQILRGQDLTRAVAVVSDIVDGDQAPPASALHAAAVPGAVQAAQ